MRIGQFFVLPFVVAGLTGCTTIVDHMVSNINHVIGVHPANKGQSKKMGQASVGAEVREVEHREKLVFGGALPATVILKDSSDNADEVIGYVIKFAIDGYYPANITLKRTADGWHVENYLGLGEVIGWFVLNPRNGGIYTLSPDQLQAVSSEDGSRPKLDSDRIRLVTVHDVPKSLRDKMTLVEYLIAKKSKGVPNGRK